MRSRPIFVSMFLALGLAQAALAGTAQGPATLPAAPVSHAAHNCVASLPGVDLSAVLPAAACAGEQGAAAQPAGNKLPFDSSPAAPNAQLPQLPLQNVTPGEWQAGSFQGMPYRIMLPSGYDPSRYIYPLVLFLHGAGENGSDNQAQLLDIGFLADDLDFRANAPFIFVAPQAPTTDYWGVATNASATPSEASAVALVQSLTSVLAVDSNRISVTGVSEGGIGVWDMINRYPGFFSAASPIAGAGLTSDAPNLVNLPILAVHGQLDFIVPAYFDEQMYAALQALGGHMLYYEIPFAFHVVWNAAYSQTIFWQWMYDQHR